MPRKSKPNYPAAVQRPVKNRGPKSYSESLAQQKLTPEEVIFWLTGQEEAIAQEKRKAATSAVVGASMDVEIQKLSKLLVLREHYGIPDDLPATVWLAKLCMNLCDEFISGFGETGTMGRPPRWEPIRRLRLIYEIETLKRDLNCMDTEAIIHYLRSTEGIVRPSDGEIHTWRTRLSEARDPRKNPLAKFSKPAPPLDELEVMRGVLHAFNDFD